LAIVGAGLDERGVRVDTAGRTSLPGVFAAGYASIPFDPRYGVHTRTDHWGRRRLAGGADRFAPDPKDAAA
jgi:NADPH-dependent 2,4-dienoyl-CoA reductase/sulfur reductase-like enzyme